MARSVNLKCRAVKTLGPDTAVTGELPAGLAQHAASCLRCQAEIARYRRLRRELGALATHTHRAPATVLPRVEQAIWSVAAPQPAARQSARMVATVAGAAAAAGVLAVAMWRRARVAA